MESHPYKKPRGVGPVTTELTPGAEPTAAQPPIANPAFRVKLGILLPVALLLRIVNQRQARVWSQAAETPVLAKVAGLAEFNKFAPLRRSAGDAHTKGIVGRSILHDYFDGRPGACARFCD